MVQRISGGVVHNMVNASRHKIGVAGGSAFVYGMWFEPGSGYHVDFTRWWHGRQRLAGYLCSR